MGAGAVVSAAGMATERDQNGNNMLNVFGRGATAGQSKSNKAKVSFVADMMFGGGLGIFQQYDDPEGIQLPEFYTDPYFADSQEYLSKFGLNLLEGTPNDYYKSLGELNYGGEEFENILGLINRDTSKAVNENLVRRGISRSGVGLSTLAKASADVNTKLRWEDYIAAVNRQDSGKKFLMGAGLDTMSGVRTAGLNNQAQVNQFNLAEMGIGMNATQIMDQRTSQDDAMWGQLLQSAIGAAGSYFGSQDTSSGGTSNLAGMADQIDLSGFTGFKGTTAPAAYGSAAYYQDPNWKL